MEHAAAAADLEHGMQHSTAAGVLQLCARPARPAAHLDLSLAQDGVRLDEALQGGAPAGVHVAAQHREVCSLQVGSQHLWAVVKLQGRA
jgi:hypothetical protein